MNQSSKSFISRSAARFVLVMALLGIGFCTVYAAANTYEVITGRDVPGSSVVRTVQLTKNAAYNTRLVTEYQSVYRLGDFGVPAKIKFPETSQLIGIVKASRQYGAWEASSSLGQTFLAAEPRQKVFGRAIIYVRINTPTTEHLGQVMQGDLVDIVTSEDWQLGYRVSETAKDVSSLHLSDSTSEIVVVLIDDATHATHSFTATLSRVGGRT